MRWASLDAIQQQAVTAKEHQVLVTGPAGSGKTQVLGARAQFLVESGVSPDSIATVSATGLGGLCRRIAARIPEELGISGCRILEDHEFFPCLELAFMDGQDSGIFEFQPHILRLHKISGRGLREIIEREYCHDPIPRNNASPEEVEMILSKNLTALQRYEDYKRKNRLLDWSDLAEIIIARQSCGGYEHILIDEMQEISALHLRLVRALARHADIFCAGCDEESIFGFAGAEYGRLGHFTETFPQAGIYLLGQCHRNPEVQVIPYRSHNEMTHMIVDAIRQTRERGGRWADHIVLARGWTTLYRLEDCLEQSGIPCRLAESGETQRMLAIRLITSPMRVVCNWKDPFAWYDCLNMIRWPEPGSSNNRYQSGEYCCSLISRLIDEPSFEDAMSAFAADQRLFERMVTPIMQISQMQDEPLAAYRLTRQTIQNWVKDRLLGDIEGNLPVLDELEDIARRCASMSEFLEAALTPLPADIQPVAANKDAVLLSSVHSAQGLEAPYCYLMDGKRAMWPLRYRTHEGPEGKEEELRTHDVACTRATTLFRRYEHISKR